MQNDIRASYTDILTGVSVLVENYDTRIARMTLTRGMGEAKGIQSKVSVLGFFNRDGNLKEMQATFMSQGSVCTSATHLLINSSKPFLLSSIKSSSNIPRKWIYTMS